MHLESSGGPLERGNMARVTSIRDRTGGGQADALPLRVRTCPDADRAQRAAQSRQDLATRPRRMSARPRSDAV